ncbi:DUF1569 domain-containing protein [Pseudomonas mangrovi]|uniref:DUF1569 domain-containing protein n=1 Tax=Pseudomonas mangrovi TaxID=2161748 RepID=A0A2T5PBJ5_9PSED|nr:DUF1569 domain-containing protein [Pseudomonas mangrovi]PTU75106.1 hypothetical protein DBO85_06490 [Pseudomonas mangrovi]
MKRRKFLGCSAAAGVALLGGGFALLPRGAAPAQTNLAAARELLAGLRGRELISLRGWSPTGVFNHCAQSVEYSLEGYPQLKPGWFRLSLGPAAFAVFGLRGAMRHSLDEPIPGAASLIEPATLAGALQRLEDAFARFAEHRGSLAPHFAYGALDHAEYAQAHVLHLYEHLSLIRPRGDHAAALSADIQSLRG